MNDGSIIVGIRHYSPEMRATLTKIYGKGIKLFNWWIRKPYHLRVKQQGFVDQFGRFYNREDAWKLAKEKGQIRNKIGCPDGTLFSEHLF